MDKSDAAFPLPPVPYDCSAREDGMPMLFWFAGQALQGLLAADAENMWTGSAIANCAFDIAEAMLAEGNRRLP